MSRIASSNKKRKNTELPLCRYGSECFRKNSEHRKKFRHPDALDSSKINTKPSCEDVEKNSKVKGDSDELDEKLKETSKFDMKENLSDEETTTKTVPKESVENVLKSMPQDFFDFWDFCSTLNAEKPHEAFSEIGLHLVGVYDLLSRNLAPKQKINLDCHWRYYYDPPEFQTVIKFDGKDFYHIGYFRDNPNELPSILASNSANVGSKLTVKGDNIFAAVNFDLTDIIKKSKDQKLKKKLNSIQDTLKMFANKKKYSLELQSPKVKARNKKIVTKTFHGLGIVVPVKNDVGYRPLPDSDATVKAILKKIVSAENEDKRLKEEESLDELITNIQFANDECDYGMGLELGIDLFCFGHSYFHSHILHLLPLAYNLLKRDKYADTVSAHLANRKQTDELDCLEV